MAANRYAEMVRWMAWPRIKNSRSSAQPGADPHDGVQATVTPAPDAEPPPRTGQNTGVGGTRHTVAATPSWGTRRVRPIRYAHSAGGAGPAEAVEGPPPAAAPGETNAELPGAVLSGTVVRGPAPVGEDAQAYEDAGLIYESPHPVSREPVDLDQGDEPVVENEGLGIFGDVATTEVTDDDEPVSAPEPPTRVIPIGASWNQSTAEPVASDEADEERRPNPFGRMRGMRWGGQPADENEARVSVRDLPPDVQLRFWRIRLTIMVVVGAVFAALTRSWEIALTLAILAGIVDTIYRSRNASSYVNGRHAGARKATSKQLVRMRRDGYFVLNDRPIPDSHEFIDHLVVGPTGVYAIDSEKWDPKLPIRTLNGKRLYVGPESQKERLEHAKWEAGQASEILSAALGTEIVVRPALAIYGPKVPWDIATIRDVDVFTGSTLRKYIKKRNRMRGKNEGVPSLTREEIRTIYDTAERTMPGAATSASPMSYTPVG